MSDENKGYIKGWIGAALAVDETERHVADRFNALISSLGRYLYTATLPHVPEDERAANLAVAIKFAAAVHKRVSRDEMLRNLTHQTLLIESCNEGGYESEPFQQRVIAANLEYTENLAKREALRVAFLDVCAPTPLASTANTQESQEK